MGQLENIESLETYIDELGNEIKQVKKASTYLQEIEAQHLLVEQQLERVKQTAETLETIQSHFADKTKEFESQIKKNENRFIELNSTVVTSFSETDHYLKEHINEIKLETSLIGEDVQQLQLETKSLEQQVVSMSSTISAVSHSIIELRKGFIQLEQNNVELKEMVQHSAENQKQSAKRIEKISIFMAIILLIAIIVIKFV